MSLDTNKKSSWLPDMFSNYVTPPDDPARNPSVADKGRSVAGVTPIDINAPSSSALPTIDTALEDQTRLIRDRQTQETANLLVNQALTANALKKVTDLQIKSEQAGINSDTQQLAVLGGINDVIQRGNIAIQLSNSKNPLDHLQLWMLQQTDPTYTAEGNATRMGFYDNAAIMLAKKGIIQQDAYTKSMDQVNQNLAAAMQPGDDLLKIMQLRETQGQERIDAITKLQDNRIKTLKDNQDMQTIVTSNMDNPAQIDSLIQQAQQNPNQTVNLNGVTLSSAALNERKQQLEDRSYLNANRTYQGVDLALGDMTIQDVIKYKTEALNSPDQTATLPSGLKVPLAKLQGRESALVNIDTSSQSQQLALQSQRRSALNETNARMLATMKIPELNALLKNGSMLNGIAFDPAAIHDEITRQQQAQTLDLQNQADIANVGDINAAAVDINKQLNTVINHVDPMSPLGKQVASYQTALNHAVAMSDPSQSPTDATRAFAAGTIDNIRRQLQADVMKQAKAESGGDEALAQAKAYTMQGQIIPPDFIRQTLIDKRINDKQTNQWLSPNDNALFNKTFYDEYGKLKAQNISQIVGLSDKELKEQAASKAIDAVKLQQSVGITDQIISSQARDGKDNPLASTWLNGGKGVSPSEILTLVKQADNDGLKNYTDAAQLDAKTSEAWMKDPHSIPTDSVAVVEQYRSAALIARLDAIRPGLGQSYVDWWNSDNRNKLISKYIESKQNTISSTPDNVALGLQTDDLAGAWGSYAQNLNDGHTQIYAEEYRRQHDELVTFKGNPTSTQVFLLDRDPVMTNTEKQQAMTTVINPLIAQAQAQNMNFDQTMSFVEQQLREAQPEDASMRKLVTKILANRDKSYETLDSFIKINQYNSNPGNMISGVPMGNVLNTVLATPLNNLNTAIGLQPDALAASTSSPGAWYTSMGK